MTIKNNDFIEKTANDALFEIEIIKNIIKIANDSLVYSECILEVDILKYRQLIDKMFSVLAVCDKRLEGAKKCINSIAIHEANLRHKRLANKG